MFTPQEKNFLINMLKTTTFNPAMPDAMVLVQNVQSILAKLQALEEAQKETPKE